MTSVTAKLTVFLATAVLGAAFDLGTKWLAFSRMERGEPVILIDGFLRFVLSENRGAAFGMLQGQFVFFVIVSIGALALLTYFSVTARHFGAGYQVALGLVGAGVIGNFYDRVALGYVRDFVGVFIGYPPVARKLFQWFGTNEWPIFNAADAFIVVGAAVLLIAFWKEERRERRAAASAPAPAAAEKP